jgi:hypothetical protein
MEANYYYDREDIPSFAPICILRRFSHNLLRVV